MYLRGVTRSRASKWDMLAVPISTVSKGPEWDGKQPISEAARDGTCYWLVERLPIGGAFASEEVMRHGKVSLTV
jgi:hypothetical protein